MASNFHLFTKNEIISKEMFPIKSKVPVRFIHLSEVYLIIYFIDSAVTWLLSLDLIFNRWSLPAYSLV